MTIRTAFDQLAEAQRRRIRAERARKLARALSPRRASDLLRLQARLLEKRTRDAVHRIMRTRRQGERRGRA
jgi:hypothetical protein